jgi:hypothetical protein
MNRTVHKLCAWSGIGCLILLAIGFVGLARFVPPPSPHESAHQIARMFGDHTTAIRFGLIISMVSATLLMPFAVSIFTHMRRAEGRHPALAYIQLCLGTLFVFEFLYLIFFWQVAAFRPDRPAAVIQTLNDMGWIPFVGLTSTFTLQSLVYGLAIILDKRPTPVFPRWLGYYNLWAALMFTPGTFDVFFHTGPLAWNGLVAFYIPVAVFASWLIINPIYLAKRVDEHIAEDHATALDADARSAEIATLTAWRQQTLAAAGQPT